MNPAPVDAAALARKYAALVELRRRRDGGGDPDGGGALRALAAEFPGCLRELDTLGLPELERRARLTAAASAGAGAPEPWVEWIGAYHELMRSALALRDPARRAGVQVDAAFAAAVRAPPHGRLGVVVLRTLSARFEVPAAEISAALFPARRPPPYDL
ncbi:MAG TPA: hypothetical protein VHL80_02450 [Polyangia bacterium]|nr:hypothetical protein [Polyangia bacterium]